MNDMSSQGSFQPAGLHGGGDTMEMQTPAGRAGNFELLSGVALRLSVEVGSTRLRLSELMGMTEGSVIELDRQASDLLDIFANGTLIARGEIVTTNGRYGIKVVEVVAPEKRFSALDRRA